MMGERIVCACCGASTAAHRAWKSLAFHQCDGCRVLFLHPQPSAQALTAAYRTHYYPHNGALPVYGNTPEEVSRQIVDCFRRAQVVPFPAGRILDFGAGNGDFAVTALAGGFDVDAVESDEVARATMTRRGVTAFPDLDAIPAQRARDGYHLVTLLDVLEHVRDPVGLLRRLRKLVRPGGALYLSVPNFGAVRARVLGPRWHEATNPTHLFLFDARSLELTLALAGFGYGRLPCFIRYPQPSRVRALASRMAQRVGCNATLRVLAPLLPPA